jgi:hypothetical protein
MTYTILFCMVYCDFVLAWVTILAVDYARLKFG